MAYLVVVDEHDPNQDQIVATWDEACEVGASAGIVWAILEGRHLRVDR